jgi:predicted ester cyclase
VLVSEQNKATVRRLVDEVMNAGRLDVVDDIYTPRMAATARAWIAPFRASFPDVHMQVVDLVDLVAEGDKVAARILCSGTQHGAWQGHPVNGQRFERVAEMYFFELHEGRITRAWGLEDNLTRMRQLGQLGPARAAPDGEATPPPAVAILKSTDIAATLDWYREVEFEVRRQELTFGEAARDGLVLQRLHVLPPLSSR